MSIYAVIKIVLMLVILFFIVVGKWSKAKPKFDNKKSKSVSSNSNSVNQKSFPNNINPDSVVYISSVVDDSVFENWLKTASPDEVKKMMITALVKLHYDEFEINDVLKKRTTKLYRSLTKQQRDDIYLEPNDFQRDLYDYINGQIEGNPYLPGCPNTSADLMYSTFKQRFAKEELYNEQTFHEIMLYTEGLLRVTKDENYAEIIFFDDSKSPDNKKRRVGCSFSISSYRGSEGLHITLQKNNWGSEFAYMMRDDGFCESITMVKQDSIYRLLKLCDNANYGKDVVKYLYNHFSTYDYSAYLKILEWFNQNKITYTTFNN